MNPLETVRGYHERSKHRWERYARSKGYLDWATQPDPFRTFHGAPRLELPLTADAVTSRYGELYEPGAIEPRPLDRASLSAFFELSLGLSAWKRHGPSRWALRCNPSSGNLHPTEGYAILPRLEGIPSGVHHYLSRDHLLEQRCAVDAAVLTPHLPAGGFLAGLSSIHWREAWKYGERAFRYCQHDVGHALAAMRYAAAALGWRALLLDGASTDDVRTLFGLGRDGDFSLVTAHDREHPEALVLVVPSTVDPVAEGRRVLDGMDALTAAVRGGTWSGEANALSPSHDDWSVIEEVAAASVKPRTPLSAALVPERPTLLRIGAGPRASTLFRQRRSAVDLDGRTSVSADALAGMLDRLLPRANTAPWDVLPWAPTIHPVLLVHRVDGLEPGIYLFERDEDAGKRLRRSFRKEFEATPAGISGLPLWNLVLADTQEAAKMVSCHQDIAADGAFTLGMLADFERALEEHGPWFYPRLFWEAGVLGQVLYLEAEAAGVRGTGIGCFFDDSMHELLGLEGTAFQSLYHFTVGGPVDDPRLQTEPPYAHLEGR